MKAVFHPSGIFYFHVYLKIKGPQKSISVFVIAVIYRLVKNGDVNTSGKAGAQIPQLPLGDDSFPGGR
jgi:hypothetical protein